MKKSVKTVGDVGQYEKKEVILPTSVRCVIYFERKDRNSTWIWIDGEDFAPDFPLPCCPGDTVGQLIDSLSTCYCGWGNAVGREIVEQLGI